MPSINSPKMAEVMHRLSVASPAVFVAITLAATYVVFLPTFLLAAIAPEFAEWLRPSGGPRSLLEAKDIASAIVKGSFAAPLIETIVFQWVPIRILRSWLGLSSWLVIPGSALLFAASHNYRLGYVVFSFLVGLVLATGFVIRDIPEGYPGTLTFVVHSIRNTIATLLVHV
jgi:uncharacterized protein